MRCSDLVGRLRYVTLQGGRAAAEPHFVTFRPQSARNHSVDTCDGASPYISHG